MYLQSIPYIALLKSFATALCPTRSLLRTICKQTADSHQNMFLVIINCGNLSECYNRGKPTRAEYSMPRLVYL